MTLYVLNAPVLTDYGLWRLEGPLSGEDARGLAAGGFVSAVGHASTAAALEGVVGRPVPVNRTAASLAAGDRALVLRVKGRLPEGAVLDAATLAGIPWELSLMTRIE